MTQKIDFESVWKHLERRMFHFETHADVLMMKNLGFTPSMWKVWRPKLIEYAELIRGNVYSEEEKRNIAFDIEYKNKEKNWIRKNVSWSIYTCDSE